MKELIQYSGMMLGEELEEAVVISGLGDSFYEAIPISIQEKFRAASKKAQDKSQEPMLDDNKLVILLNQSSTDETPTDTSEGWREREETRKRRSAFGLPASQSSADSKKAADRQENERRKIIYGENYQPVTGSDEAKRKDKIENTLTKDVSKSSKKNRYGDPMKAIGDISILDDDPSDLPDPSTLQTMGNEESATEEEEVKRYYCSQCGNEVGAEGEICDNHNEEID